MDGIQATKIIREIGVKIPIIALTANAVTGVKETLIGAGMDDFLSKPIVKTSLHQILLSWIPATKLANTPIESVTTVEAEPETRADFWKRIELIEDISIGIGLNRVSGQKDVYERSLKFLVKEIEKCTRNSNEFLAENDLHNFCIEVHSMKSSLANVGAMELSTKAHDLEIASDKNDAVFCAINLPPFLKALDELNANLKEAFILTAYGKSPAEIPPELNSIFRRMSDAFEEMDFEKINKELDNLDELNLGDELKEEIEQVKDSVLVMDYGSAMEVMRKLLQKPD
jgi:CheY-like chemotaxis protein